jgi:hypothetical protein
MMVDLHFRVHSFVPFVANEATLKAEVVLSRKINDDGREGPQPMKNLDLFIHLALSFPCVAGRLSIKWLGFAAVYASGR